MRGILEHIERHFHSNGLCQCPCDECTTSLHLCICTDCPCDGTAVSHITAYEDDESSWYPSSEHYTPQEPE